MLAPSHRRHSLVLSLGLLAGCWGRNLGYGADTAPQTGGTAVSECGDESLYGDGWRIEGTVALQDPEGTLDLAGKCIDAIDPTPALGGGDPTILASSVVCDDGSFVIAGITENPTIGAFVVVDDCEGEDDELMISATGIAGDKVEGLGPDDAITGIRARVIDQGYRLTLLEDLKLAGYDGEEGPEFQFLGGRLVDGADQTDDAVPFDDYTISCSACVYAPSYFDSDPSDGLFTTGAEANASTSADADSLWLVPMASIGTYTCTDDGGNDLYTTTYGSLPGYGTFVDMRCVAQ